MKTPFSHKQFSSAFQLSLGLLAISIGFSNPSFATSKGYDAPAQVIRKDGVPCFFVAKPDNTPAPIGQSLSVEINRGPTTWHIYENSGVEPFPASAAQCIKYGTAWTTGKVLTKPAPLEIGVPYYADFGTEHLFRVTFCLAKNAGGELLLTKWAEDGNHCTNQILNEADKPSVWQRMFSK
ncbi:MAG: hypothetical protein WBD81_21795 [Collimonas pratensis]|uniref:hypothetical protein n=1 Tax=Collimonas pratensis TaxID=279113 RepID=UPI003C78570D